MSYHWNFETLLQFWRLWCRGLWNTFSLAVIAIVLGTLLALLVVTALYSKFKVVRIIARVYVDLFRAIPALVLLGTLYFTLPILLGLRLGAFQTAVIGLTLNLAPFVVECIRSAIESIPQIQYDSATVMGFRGWRRSYYIVGPQVFRRLLPPVVGQYTTTMKLTSLAATIGVEDLWNSTSQITTLTSLPLEAKIAGAALYVVIILPLLWVAIWLEHRSGIKGLGAGSER